MNCYDAAQPNGIITAEEDLLVAFFIHDLKYIHRKNPSGYLEVLQERNLELRVIPELQHNCSSEALERDSIHLDFPYKDKASERGYILKFHSKLFRTCEFLSV